MIKLPVTLEQAEHLQFARQEIARYRERHEQWGNASVLTAEASYAMVRHILRQASLHSPKLRLMVMDLARSGDEDADEVLRNLIIEYQSCREPLPSELITYNMEVLNCSRHKHPARKKKSNLLRDMAISLTVAALVERFGLKATGNSARRRSACSIVAEALEEAHMKMTNKAVEAIWQRYQRVMPGWTGPVWTFVP